MGANGELGQSSARRGCAGVCPAAREIANVKLLYRGLSAQSSEVDTRVDQVAAADEQLKVSRVNSHYQLSKKPVFPPLGED